MKSLSQYVLLLLAGASGFKLKEARANGAPAPAATAGEQGRRRT